ncbi:MAG: hypothetical protein ACI9C4_000735 [Paraglaciecola sp.]|jgi:hypothetical protein
MRNCLGVIANSGFELASECLHFGKKPLINPWLDNLSNVHMPKF